MLGGHDSSTTRVTDISGSLCVSVSFSDTLKGSERTHVSCVGDACNNLSRNSFRKFYKDDSWRHDFRVARTTIELTSSFRRQKHEYSSISLAHDVLGNSLEHRDTGNRS